MPIETSNLDQFIFRPDNRAEISQQHVNAIANSIRTCNLLYMRPIIVNEYMEIIDGQHRVLAARQVGVSVFYDVQYNLKPEDIVLLSQSKSWTFADHLHFYANNGYEEYKKLNEFIKFNDISLRVALTLLIGSAHDEHQKFRSGKFTMPGALDSVGLQLCKETQRTLCKQNGHSAYMYATKFWKAHLVLSRNENFCVEKWRKNVKQMSERFCPKASYKDYLKLFVFIHNFRNNKKICITDEDFDYKNTEDKDG